MAEKTRLVFAVLIKMTKEDNFPEAVATGKKYMLTEIYVNYAYMCGIDLYPLAPTSTREHIRSILRQVNAVLLPGGAGDVVKPNPDPVHASELILSTYTEAVRVILEEAMDLNRQGIYLPIYGICLGFEAIIGMAVGDIGIVEKRPGCVNYNTSLKFTEEARQSRWLAALSPEVRHSLATEDITFNYHSYYVTSCSVETPQFRKGRLAYTGLQR